MRDGLVRNLDAYHEGGHLCKQRCSVSLARRNIQHAFPAAEIACKKISMQVFNFGLSSELGG
jgi:hypothetical protein